MVVCYGLGSTYESWNARHQLAFLVLLAEAYEAQSVSAHDPFLSKDELEALEALGIEQAQLPRSASRIMGSAVFISCRTVRPRSTPTFCMALPKLWTSC